MCALAKGGLLLAACFQLGLAFEYQVTIEPTVDPNTVGSGVSTLAGGLNHPGGTPFGLREGKLYVADSRNHVIKAIDRGSGGVETVAGKEGVKGFVDGRKQEAHLHNPNSVAVSSDGHVYIADTMNHAIRRLSMNSYEVDTLCGGKSSTQAESVTGSGNVTGLWSPMSLAVWDVDGELALLVADTDNHRIVRLTPHADQTQTPWKLSLFAGRGVKGYENGGAHAASFRYPHAVAVCKGSVLVQQTRRRLSEAAGGEEEDAHAEAKTTTVLVADTANHVIRILRPQPSASLRAGEYDGWAQPLVATLAGDGSPGSEDSLTKREKPKASMLLTSVLPARFAMPRGVDCDGEGGAVVADMYNQAVRHIGANGITVTLAGGERRGGANGVGTQAEFSEPVGIFYHAGEKNAYVVEQGGQRVRRVGVGDLAIVVVTSAAPLPRRPSMGAGALAGAAAAWLAWRRRPHSDRPTRQGRLAEKRPTARMSVRA